MNYGDHNFIEITQHVERVEPVEFVVSRSDEPSGIWA